MSRLFSSAPVLLTLAALFWAGNTVLARGMSETVPPIALAWSRWVIATLILLPFAMPHLRTDWPRVADNWKMLAFLAAMGAGSYNTLHYIGLNATPALNALVIGAAGPMLIALASFLAFRDKLGSGQTIGIALAAVGVLIIVAKGNPSNLAAANFNSGDLWIFAAIASWAVYTAYLRKKPPIHWLSFSLVTFALAAVYNFPLFIAETIAGRQLQATWQTAATIGYVSVFPSVLSYIFFNRGVELIGSNRAGAYIYLIPVFGSALAVMLLGEQFRWHHAAAFGLVMGGVALAAKRG